MREALLEIWEMPKEQFEQLLMYGVLFWIVILSVIIGTAFISAAIKVYRENKTT